MKASAYNRKKKSWASSSPATPLDKYAEKLRNLNVVDTATALEMKPPPQQPRRRGEPPTPKA